MSNWTRIQAKGKTNVNGAHSGSASFASLPIVGHQIFVVGWAFVSAATPPASASVSVTDNQAGNTYNPEKQVYQNTTNGMLAFVVECPKVVGSTGTFTITVDVGSANTASIFSFDLIEYSNGKTATELDKSISNVSTANGTTADTTATATTTTNDELLWAVTCIENGQASITRQVAGTAPSSGWTNDINDLGGASSQAGTAEYITTSATVAARYVWTYPTGSPFAAVLATFPSVIAFRKTLSGIGSHVGGRQAQGWS